MQLSMWILADWLKSYSPRVCILEGQCILQNVRLFSDNLRISRTTVYLSESNGRIMCINGRDILILNTDDINQVFNDILDAFDYYNEWSNTAYDAISSGCSASDLLSMGGQLLDYFLLLADSTFLIYERYCSEYFKLNNPFVRENLNIQLKPMEVLHEIDSLPHIRQHGIAPYNMTYSSQGDHNSAACNLFINNTHVGWLVALRGSDRMFSQAELDLLAVLGKTMAQWLEHNQYSEQRLDINNIFYALLDETAQDRSPEDNNLLVRRLEAFHWQESDPKQIYVLRRENTGTYTWHPIMGLLKNSNKECFSFYYQDFLVLLVNQALTDSASLERELSYYLQQFQCTAGKSPEFTNILQIRKFYNAAKIAVLYPKDETSIILDFNDAIIPYLLFLIKSYSATELCHTGLLFLKQYDKEHDTQLYDTLRMYLQLERNCTVAAQQMNVHRSTLIYRINRIQELTGIDLENPSERFHLLLSFLLE